MASMFKRKFPLDSVYLEDYEPSQRWRLAGGPKSKQKTLGTEIVQFEPNTPLAANERPSSLVFELSGNRPLLCNHMFRFHIKAQMEHQVTNETDKTTSWEPLDADAQNKDLIFLPNWFEKMIASVDIVVGNNKIQLHIENNDIAHELNTMLYYMMHPDLINFIAPDPLNPVRMVPNGLDNNIREASAIFKELVPGMMSDHPFTFTWLPMHMFPFWQLPNHELDRPQVELPLHLIGKMFITIHFKPQQHVVWRTTDPTKDNTKYRLNFKRFVLVAEENILPPGKVPRPSQISFPCLIRDSKCETIPAGETEYKVRYSNCPLPEHIVLFAVDKKIHAGNYDFQKATFDIKTPYFKVHNLKEIELLYNNQSFTSRTPNFEQFGGASCTLNTLNALRVDGLFGVKLNPLKYPYQAVAQEFTDGPFPMAVVYFTLGNGTRQRRHPLQTDGTALKNDHDMELILRFHTAGAAADATYCIYFCYTDRAMIYDTASNKFINPLKPYL